MTGTSLRFGLMCHGPILQAWQGAAVDDLLTAGSFQLALIIRPAPSVGVGQRGLGKLRDPELRRTLLWRLYQRLRLQRLRSGRPVDRSKAFEAVDVVTCAVERRGRHSEYFSETDVETIRSYDLDFILRFAFGIIQGDILKAARYGVWSYHHDDERVIRGRPPCFWEVARGYTITGAILQRLTDTLDAGVVLYRGEFGTRWEYGANRDQVFFGSADWPARVCRQILAGDTSIVTGVPSATAAPILRVPVNRDMVAFLAGQIRGLAVSRLKRWFRYELWNVGVCREPIEAALARGRLNDVSWAPSLGRRRFIADPFAVQTATGATVYVEDLDFAASGKGRIARFALAESWDGWHLEEALETQEHLSYPFLFEAEGQIWCVPESYEARACRLYRVAADGKLRMESVLLESAEFVDPTVFRHDGRWWLFCTDRAKGSGLKLYAYHARDFRGPWVPHALNPLKCDITSARPAGPPFLLDGALCRPSARLLAWVRQRRGRASNHGAVAGTLRGGHRGPHRSGRSRTVSPRFPYPGRVRRLVAGRRQAVDDLAPVVPPQAPSHAAPGAAPVIVPYRLMKSDGRACTGGYAGTLRQRKFSRPTGIMERTDTQAAAVFGEGLVCCVSEQVLRLRAA